MEVIYIGWSSNEKAVGLDAVIPSRYMFLNYRVRVHSGMDYIAP